MTKSLIASLAFVALGSIGCTPSAEKVCNHVMELASKDGDEKMSEESKKKKLDRCIEKVNEEKTKDPDRYKCVAKCAMAATDFKDFRKCEDKDTCPKKDDDSKAKKKDDDDSDKKAKKSDDDDSDKKKKKSDDDDSDSKKKKKKSDDE